MYGYLRGFRRGLSAVSHLLITSHYSSLAINNKLQVDAVFLDFPKALDKVAHKALPNDLCYLSSAVNVLISLEPT